MRWFTPVFYPMLESTSATSVVDTCHIGIPLIYKGTTSPPRCSMTSRQNTTKKFVPSHQIMPNATNTARNYFNCLKLSDVFLIGVVIQAHLLHIVPTELFEHRGSHLVCYDGLPYPSSRRHRADIRPFNGRFDRRLRLDVHAFLRVIKSRDGFHGCPQYNGLSVGDATLQTPSVI